MLKLKRSTEYGLIAMLYMSRKKVKSPEAVTTAREICESYGLPFEITAKTLQLLKRFGFIDSLHGVQGGYILQRKLEEINLEEFLNHMEGGQKIVECCPIHNGGKHESKCDYRHKCEIRPFMHNLNSKVSGLFKGISLAEMGTRGLHG